MITIDGSQGEGGGQILRSSLALSMVTGTPLRIEKIRAGRAKPGLLRQHLTAVTAASRVSNAEVIGAVLGSRELEFRPQGINAGDYRFSIGSAGSTTLVLQTILPALMVADGPSTVRIEGGTHNPHAPPVDFLARSFLPVLERMGPRVSVALERPGFFPAGGGRIVVQIEPGRCRLPDGTSVAQRPSEVQHPDLADKTPDNSPGLSRIELDDCGEIRERVCRAVAAGLSRGIAERELKVIREGLGWPPECLRVEDLDPACGPGNVLIIELACEHVTAVFTGFGMRGVTSEAVAADALGQAKRYLEADVPVCEHLADQLLLPMAMAGGGSFATLPLTPHSTTNIDVIRRFLPVLIDVTSEGAQRCRVEVKRL